ncbi:carbohydrate-binding module family 18 protein [Piromyces sp. E2]|nr:carbohydrate-binding module family 18 protein [Piromyces sp. E2]|eukprot:OUM56108.1 carbohydrate-binding module family 18 protein [Piromyces sp. E2]
MFMIIDKIKIIPKLYKNGTTSYKEYNDNQIYTVYAKCNEAAYKNLKTNPFIGDEKNEGSSDCNVTFVTKTEIYKTTGKLQLIGFNSRKFKKLSWKIKLDKSILGRKTIKFRGNANDPTLMRDKLSSELYRALGVPTYSSAYARLMINNDIYGLYNLVDSVNDKWIAPIIHGDDNARVGTSYKTYAGADLKYLGDAAKPYKRTGAYEVDKADASDTEAKGNDFYRLIHFSKTFKQWDDNGNFALYYNPEQNKYQIIPYDFDGTFLSNLDSDRFSKNYKKDVNDCITWANNARIDKDTYFISTLFKHTLIKDRYNEIMRDTVNKLFNVNSISPLIDSLSTLIEEDIAWNFGLIDKLDSSIPGYVNHFTLQNFKDNTNYKNTTTTTITKKTTTTSKKATSTIKISDSDSYRCGPEFGRCQYEDDCCSSYGHCGTGDAFCGTGCQKGYGLCY